MSDEIIKLKKEIDRLKKSVKKQRYGLVWMNIPEAFEDNVENKLPVLKEVPELAIKNNDGKPTHILIEGDNYHALTCLNYTHGNKIDVIYIDPPYNTGSDGFRYRDKRIMEKFPDGTEVPRDHPFRHSYWLSFMNKRLELAKNLLKDTGVIFISIDDNEQAQLKLLCDKVFGENNFLANFIWHRTQTPPRLSKNVAHVHDYILCYAKKITSVQLNKIPLKEDYVKKTYKNPDSDPRGPWRLVPLLQPDSSLNKEFTLKMPDGRNIKGKWRCSKETFNEYIKDKRLVISKTGNPNRKLFLSEIEGQISDTWLDNIATNEMGSKEIEEFFGTNAYFTSPKPVYLISYLLNLSSNKDSLILDFFAGSGTTGQAVLETNNSDKGNRKFILCTNNEVNEKTEKELVEKGIQKTSPKYEKEGICQKVCYPRLKKVINGYTIQNNEKVNGLGSSLKYYKTAFIGKNNILDATDEDKIELAHNAGELLAIAENTLELVKQNKYYQLFEEHFKEKYTAIYFREELDQFDKFIEMVKKLDKKITVYVFSWGEEELVDEFDNLDNVKVKTIPLPILEIYRNIYNLVK